QPKADPRRGAPAEELGETVIAATTTQRLLLSLATGDVELECGPGVVVEAPNERRLQAVDDAQDGQVVAHGREVSLARIAQLVGDPWCARVELGHGRVLRVEQPERVLVEPLALDRRQPIGMECVIGGQCRDVGRPAGGITDRVEEDLHLVEAGQAIEAPAELDDLGIDGRTGVADRLDVELPELAVAAGLGAVIPEHRAGHRQLDRLRPGLHPMLDIGAHDTGGRVRPERPRFALIAAVGDPEELLLDDVSDSAHATLEDGGLLEHRRLDLAVAIAPGQVRGNGLEAPEGRPFRGQQVAGAAWGAEGGHGPKSSGRTGVQTVDRSGRSSPGPDRWQPQSRSRWTEITSLSSSIRLITLASWLTVATCRVAVTTAIWSGRTLTAAARMLTLCSATTWVMSLSSPVRS